MATYLTYYIFHCFDIQLQHLNILQHVHLIELSHHLNLLLRHFGTVGAFASSVKGGKCWYIVELVWEWSGLQWYHHVGPCLRCFTVLDWFGVNLKLKSVSGLCSVPVVV